MKLQLLVDSDEFWRSLAADIAVARERVFAQTLSLEGDRAGKGLVEALKRSSCKDRRILVDSYTKFIQNDRFLYTPRNLLNKRLRAEVRETSRMIADARQSGIGVEFMNPVGRFLLNFGARNHKKLIVIDDSISYIGGINFSAHNFDWHDLMVRIDDPAVAAFLREDFLAVWKGEERQRSASFPGLELYACDGPSNPPVFDRVIELMRGATKSIFVASPYITFPFWEPLGDARRRGVQVTVVSPKENNYAQMKRYIIWESRRYGVDLRLYLGRMMHLKALLVDDRWLVLGSSNFDILSYYTHQEIVAIFTDAGLIADFKARVERPDLAASVPCDETISETVGRIANLHLRAVSTLFLLGGRRSAAPK